MSQAVIKVENLSKLYRLGQVGKRSFRHDLKQWWSTLRGMENPYFQKAAENIRTEKSNNDYVWALKNVNFEVGRGEVVGIIGRNGAGKSTLLKVLSRTTGPTKGKIKVKGRIASLLEVGTGFHPELTGRENIFLNGAILGMTTREIRQKLDEMIDFAGVERYIDTPVKRYSSGMYVRLAFAVAAHLEPEILIVDEVLAVGDAEFQKKCLGKMKEVSDREGRTVLFVSHNMEAVRKLCGTSIYMKHGQVVEKGLTSNIVNLYQEAVEVKTNATFSYQGTKPQIINVELDTARLSASEIYLKVVFKSPTPLKYVNPGFVIYNSLNVPVFGSNLLLHQPKNEIKNRNCSEGEFTAVVPKVALHSGLYMISVWLGDEFTNFDYIEHALTFEYQSDRVYINKPDVYAIGSVDQEVCWKSLN